MWFIIALQCSGKAVAVGTRMTLKISGVDLVAGLVNVNNAVWREGGREGAA